PTPARWPASVYSLGAQPRASAHVSGDPRSPATVEKRSSARVLAPGWNSAAFVKAETSSVTTSSPKAPAPFACGRRSGTFIRLKCCSVSTRWWSCSTIGPSGPTVRELRSLTAGMPAWVVEPVPWSDTDARSLLGWASAGGRRRAAGAASERRALPAVAAQAAEQDVGDGDVHVVGVAGVQARGRTDGARDVLDATAPRAHDVVVVVASFQLVPARPPGQVEP